MSTIVEDSSTHLILNTIFNNYILAEIGFYCKNLISVKMYLRY